MIIFGSKGVTYNHKDGDFYCPSCCDVVAFRHKRVRRFFTLYFVPCIPLDLLGEYLECQNCAGTFDLAVRDHDPRAEEARFVAKFHEAIRMTMIQMVIADGVVGDAEIETVKGIYESLTKTSVEARSLREECDTARAQDISQVVEGFAATLNARGKEMVLSSAVQVANSDGEFSDQEQELALKIADALEMSRAHARGVIAEVLGR